MKLLTLVIVLGLGMTAVSIVPPVAAAPQEEEPSSDDVAALEKRVAELEVLNKGLSERLDAQQELIDRAYAWMKGLPAAGSMLQQKVAEARRDGFEKAGPNPRSKKAVLDGLHGFAAALANGNPAAPKPKTETGRRSRR